MTALAEILQALGIKGNEILVQVIGFVILFIALRKFLWKPILDITKSREDEVRSIYDAAEKAKKEMEDLKADFQSRITNIDEEAQKRLADAVKKGQEMGEEIVQSARKQASLEQEKAMNAIREETIKARVELRDFAVGLAFDISSRLLKTQIDKKANEALVQQFLADIDAMEKN